MSRTRNRESRNGRFFPEDNLRIRRSPFGHNGFFSAWPTDPFLRAAQAADRISREPRVSEKIQPREGFELRVQIRPEGARSETTFRNRFSLS